MNVADAHNLALRVKEMPRETTDVLIGMIAQHFANFAELDRETLAVYLSEAEAITS